MNLCRFIAFIVPDFNQLSCTPQHHLTYNTIAHLNFNPTNQLHYFTIIRFWDTIKTSALWPRVCRENSTPTISFYWHSDHEADKYNLLPPLLHTRATQTTLTRPSPISEINFLQFANRDLTTASYAKCPKLVLLVLLVGVLLWESLWSFQRALYTDGALFIHSIRPRYHCSASPVFTGSGGGVGRPNIKSTTSHNYTDRGRVASFYCPPALHYFRLTVEDAWWWLSHCCHSLVLSPKYR